MSSIAKTVYIFRWAKLPPEVRVIKDRWLGASDDNLESMLEPARDASVTVFHSSREQYAKLAVR